MNNFTFFNPTRIHFGGEQIIKLAEEIPANAKILITYGGGSIKKNGVLDQVYTALVGRNYEEFGGIEPNPHYETLMKAVEIVKTKKIDFILAVGGGSVIDGSKFIAAAACYEGDPWEILLSYGSKVTAAIPLGTVLTLAATGSEMNAGSVITKAATQDKLFFMSPFVQPRFSILDPKTTYTLPPRQIANGVVDAYIHVLEQYATYSVNAKVQDRFAESLLSILVEEGPAALTNPQDYDVRANLMWTATMALNGLLTTGVPTDWATHMIGHEITALYGLDHAQALAVVQTALWKHKFASKQAKLAQYAERVFGIKEGNQEQKARAAIEHTEAFFIKMGSPVRLSDYKLGEEIIEKVVAKLVEHNHVALGEYQDIKPDDVRAILKLAL